MFKSSRYLIVGNGMVAGRLLDELLSRGVKGEDIAVIGAEPHGSYNRIMLSAVLAGDSNIESIVFKDFDWYRDNKVLLISGEKVIRIDRDKRCVHTDNEKVVGYEHLILATGSRSSTIPAKNTHLAHIFPFRSISDTDAMVSVAKTAKNVMVVGGGLLGLEAAYGLVKFGAKVTLVHRSGWLLNRQLDPVAAAMLKNIMASFGIEFCLNDEVDAFIGDQQVRAARLKSGAEVSCEMAVIATGITPNAELGLNAGLEGNRAIAVNETMLTSDASISALGECVEFDGQTFGLVDPLWRHAESLAARLVSNVRVPFEILPTATKLKVSGIQVFSAGEVGNQAHLTPWVVRDDEVNIYRKLLIEETANGSFIRGIVLFGDVTSGAWYFELMQHNHDVSGLLPNLVLGEAFVNREQVKQIKLAKAV